MLDSVTFLERPSLNGSVAVLGIPTDLGKDVDGTSDGPDHLRKHDLISALESLGLTIHDLSNLSLPQRESVPRGDPRTKYLMGVLETARKVACEVYFQILNQGTKVVALGGDHSMSLGTISGASAALGGDIGVVWIDAHGDMNTHKTSKTGHVHGMPAAALMGFGHLALVNIFASGAKVKKENMLFIGLQDVDQSEIDLIRREKLQVVTIMDMLEKGFGFATKKVGELQSRVKNIWVSLDVDAIDKDAAPASYMATSGGLTYREITNLAKYIGKACNVIGMDIAEFMPSRDDEDDKTTQLIIQLIANFLGGEYSWYTKYLRQYSS